MKHKYCLLSPSLKKCISEVLTTRFTRLTPKPSILESFEYHLDDDRSCLQISYLGDAASGRIHIQYQESQREQADIIFKIVPSSSLRHISVSFHSNYDNNSFSIKMK